MSATVFNLITMSVGLGLLYAIPIVLLISGRSFMFSPWYDAIVYRHPDSKFKLKGPITGETVWLFVHKKNSKESLIRAMVILDEMKFHAALLCRDI